jgi:thiol-disulfide isomerase/thioredoxin
MYYNLLKYWTCFLLLTPFLLYSQSSIKKVHLRGTLINFSNQVFIEDISDLKNLTTQNINRIITPDSLGSFELNFEISKPNYFRIGRNILYLEPGDKLSMTIDYEYPENAVFSSSSKRTKEANDYLKTTPFHNGGSFLEAGLGIKETIQLTIGAILTSSKKRENSLTKYAYISPKFRKLEKARINADILNSLFYIPAYFPYIHKTPADSVPPFMKSYKEISAPYITKYRKNFIKSEYLHLDVFRRVIFWLADDSVIRKSFPSEISNWLTAELLAIKIKGEKEKDSLYSFLPEINKLQVNKYKQALIEKINILTNFSDGDDARDFFFTDNNNHQIGLSQFKGKVIYIDIWATWCGPCLQEMPFLDTLRNRYKEDSSLVFISLSIDENRELWKSALLKRNLTGYQFITNRARLKEYNVISVPRVIIIDKDFTVAAMNGPSPSSQGIADYLNSLLTKEPMKED